jgi:hypothetical protein
VLVLPVVRAVSRLFLRRPCRNRLRTIAARYARTVSMRTGVGEDHTLRKASATRSSASAGTPLRARAYR